MSETTQEVTKEKFNKPEQFKYLSETVVEAINFASVEDQNRYLQMIKDKFEPKKSGGATKFPHKKDAEGNILECYCRLKQEYRPLEEMQMSKDEPKGVTSLASKHQYRLSQKAKEHEAEAVKYFMDPTPENIQLGQAEIAKANKIKATLELPETYADANLEYLKKDKEGEA